MFVAFFAHQSFEKFCTVCFCFALSHDTMLLGAGNDDSCGSLGDFVLGAVVWTVFEALEKRSKVGERVHCVQAQKQRMLALHRELKSKTRPSAGASVSDVLYACILSSWELVVSGISIKICRLAAGKNLAMCSKLTSQSSPASEPFTPQETHGFPTQVNVLHKIF